MKMEMVKLIKVEETRDASPNTKWELFYLVGLFRPGFFKAESILPNGRNLPLNEGTGTTVTGSEGTVLDIYGATWQSVDVPVFDESCLSGPNPCFDAEGMTPGYYNLNMTVTERLDMCLFVRGWKRRSRKPGTDHLLLSRGYRLKIPGQRN